MQNIEIWATYFLLKEGCFKFRIKDHLESIKCTLSGRRRIKKNNANAYK